MKETAFSPYNEIYINRLHSLDKNNMTVQHYHDTYEIYLALGGKRYMFFDNICYTLQRGDIAVIKPFNIHYSQSLDSSYYDRYVINFKMDSFEPVLTRDEIYMLTQKLQACIIHLTDEQTRRMFDLYDNIKTYSERDGFLSDKLVLFEILKLIMYIIECSDAGKAESEERIPENIVRILTYINEHYADELSLDDISAAVNLSKFHMCRIFKDITGATIAEYLNNVRLTKIHSLLVNTNESLGVIAAQTGFSSSVNLARVFKKAYGVSPSEFRKLQYEKQA